MNRAELLNFLKEQSDYQLSLSNQIQQVHRIFNVTTMQNLLNQAQDQKNVLDKIKEELNANAIQEVNDNLVLYSMFYSLQNEIYQKLMASGQIETILLTLIPPPEIPNSMKLQLNDPIVTLSQSNDNLFSEALLDMMNVHSSLPEKNTPEGNLDRQFSLLGTAALLEDFEGPAPVINAEPIDKLKSNDSAIAWEEVEVLDSRSLPQRLSPNPALFFNAKNSSAQEDNEEPSSKNAKKRKTANKTLPETDSLKDKRARNLLAARRYRGRQKNIEMDKEKHMQQIIKENEQLRAKIDRMEKEYAKLKNSVIKKELTAKRSFSI